MGGPGLGDLAEEPQELRERVRHTGGGAFLRGSSEDDPGPDKAGELSWESSNERTGAEV